MSLQGSLDTFALPDVLVLLASTHKTGELEVVGSRRASPALSPDISGRLWLEQGQLAGYDVGRAVDSVDALFELLRLDAGNFSFGSGSAAEPIAAQEIEPLLGEAQARLIEWREIELVVPSLAAWLELAPEAPSTTVSVSAAQWRLVVAIGGGCAVEQVVQTLGLGELGGCRAVKELAEVGLVSIEAPRAIQPGSSTAPLPSTALDADPASANVGNADGGDEPAGSAPMYAELEHLGDLPDLVFTTVVDEDELDEEDAPAPVSFGHGRDETRTGFFTDATPRSAPASLPDVQDLDSLVGLPSRFATGTEPAPPAMAQPGSDSGHHGLVGSADPATAGHDLDEVDGDEPLNRGLLLKFLSSVRN